nr:DUF6783 domain-containing protein [Blautia glucerasea]
MCCRVHRERTGNGLLHFQPFPSLRYISPEFGCRSRYCALIWAKSPTNYNAHLAESLFQTCARIAEFRQHEDLPEVYLAVSQHPLY